MRTLSSRVLASLVLSSLALAPTVALADGAVAVAVTLPDKSPVHRDFASGMVAEAHARFAMLSPALSPEEVGACQVDERCLLSLAKSRGASHLMLVGVASLGPREFVVSLRVLEGESGAEVVSLSDLTEPGLDPAALGRALAARAFDGATGLPQKDAGAAVSEAPSRAPAMGAPRRWTGTNPLSLVGWGVVGAGALGGTAALLAGVPLFLDNGGDVEGYALAAGTGVAGMLALGFGLVATDAWLVNPE